jgi:ubiquinone/menaquinone biosynthesis C-methylase UbiE
VAADLVAIAEPPPGARVLDVGTGTGVGAAAATQAVGTEGIAVGVDMAPSMLAVARRARPGLRLAAAEAIQLPFRDATFDVVTANFVVQEFARYDTAMFDLVRVLKPGGRLAASTWTPEEDELQATWRSLVEATVGQEMVRSARSDAAPWWERFGSPGPLQEMLRDVGLRQTRVERRTYRFSMNRDDYVAEQGTRALGRFVHGMLGDKGWAAFEDRARTTFADRFGGRIDDSRDVLLALGTKP